MLTENDKRYIALAAMDLGTGNFLIRPRDDEYKSFIRQMDTLLCQGAHNEYEQEMVDYFNACWDPDALEKYNEKYK